MNNDGEWVLLQEALNLAGNMKPGTFSYHVRANHVRVKEGTGTRNQKYYVPDILKLKNLRRERTGGYKQGQWRDNPVFSSSFEPAQEEDMEAIVDISIRTFHDTNVTPIEKRIAWLRQNRETFFVVRNNEGKVAAYASLFPTTKLSAIELILTSQIRVGDIPPAEIAPFTPGQTINLYIMALCVDPSLIGYAKRACGARLIRGLFEFFLDLAKRGVEIDLIAARSRKGDGLRILRQLGIPQVPSVVSGMSIFAVRVAESGIPLIMEYKDLLRRWREQQQTFVRFNTPPE